MNSKFFFAAALAAASFGAAAAAGDLGASVYLPDYGRIDIGRVPAPPVLVYPQPIVVAPQPVAVRQQPVYMHVPPGHAKKWSKHCQRYNACGQPVYFVQESWYQQNVAQRQPGQGRYDVQQHGDRSDRHEEKHDKHHDKQEKHEKKHGKHGD